jgi:hypothetical protein
MALSRIGSFKIQFEVRLIRPTPYTYNRPTHRRELAGEWKILLDSQNAGTSILPSLPSVYTSTTINIVAPREG